MAPGSLATAAAGFCGFYIWSRLSVRSFGHFGPFGMGKNHPFPMAASCIGVTPQNNGPVSFTGPSHYHITSHWARLLYRYSTALYCDSGAPLPEAAEFYLVVGAA